MDADDEREALLRAIFDAPKDDLLRLVFADWLDEHREPEWAELIRLQCQPAAARQSSRREEELISCVFPAADPREPFERGFRVWKRIEVSTETLADPAELRRLALRDHPEWYGATELKLIGGIIHSGKTIQTILTNPITARVEHLDISGSIIRVNEGPPGRRDGPPPEYEFRPVVTVQAVEALVNAREARRLTHLDLRNNDLDNDAARAIVHSTNLIRLKSLLMFDGNQLRGRTWQQLLERFGSDVVQ